MPTYRKFNVRSAIFLVVALFLYFPLAAHSLVRVGTLDKASIDAWNTFRKAQPFQTQVVAVAPPTKTTSGTLIFSEPPPALSWEKIRDMLSPISSGCGIFEWQIMAGGFVRDVVCTLKKGQGESDLTEALAQIQLNAFGAVAIPNVALPLPARKMSASSLNKEFSGRDLYNWLTDPDQKYRANPVAPAIDLKDLLQHRASGVFWNSGRTLVLWTLSRDRPMSSVDTADIRRFAVGSDLILGAIANESTVVVVGRARRESLAHMPPLRAETILLLAGSQEEELAQSYQRNDLISGKGTDGVDRAPILLSPQLVDTEFGNLLNVADQLLKGWSQANKVVYRHFPYPPPPDFPFKEPASRVEEGRQSFLFNWNTDGVAYRQQIEDLSVVVPLRTGSLSIIYGDPRNRPVGMEETAYRYFSNSGDTTLARVLQYATLYMVFRQFEIKAAAPPVSNRYQAFNKNLSKATADVLAYIAKDLGGGAGRDLLDKYWSHNLPERLLPAGMANMRNNFKNMYVELSRAEAMRMRQENESTGGAFFLRLRNIADSTRRRQGATPPGTEYDISAEERSRIAERFSAGEARAPIQIAAEQLDIWKSISPPAQADDSWNVTAYVVESVPRDELEGGVGGHNIDAGLIRFQRSETQASGEVTVTADGSGNILVHYSNADSGKLGAVSRAVGTNKALDSRGIKAAARKALNENPSKPAVAIEEVAAAGGKTREFAVFGKSTAGFGVRPVTQLEQEALAQLAAGGHESIVVERLDTGAFALTRTGSAEATEVESMTALYEALSGGLVRSAGNEKGVEIFVRGVSGEKAEAIIALAQSNLRRYTSETVDHLLAGGGTRVPLSVRPKLVNARIANNGIRIDRSKVAVSRVVSGHFAGFMKITVPITVRSNSKKPIFLRIVFFMREFSERAKERVVSALERIASLIGRETSLAEFNSTLKRELAADLKELNIDALLIRKDNDAMGKVNEIILGSRISTETISCGCRGSMHDSPCGRRLERA